jgi:hypothetical protein
MSASLTDLTGSIKNLDAMRVHAAAGCRCDRCDWLSGGMPECVFDGSVSYSNMTPPCFFGGMAHSLSLRRFVTRVAAKSTLCLRALGLP